MKGFKALILMLCMSSAFSAFAQLGKVQYEDAEEQFAVGKYAEALELLEASEKSMGKTNPMIEHLRILTRTELLKQDINANIAQLEPAKKEAAGFLAKYSGDTRLEDKYREVYKASKTLAAFPTRQDLEKKKEQEAADREAKERETLLPGYRDGMTEQEVIAKIPGYSYSQILNSGNKGLVFGTDGLIVVTVSKNTGKTCAYSITFEFKEEGKGCTEGRNGYEQKKAEITQKLGVEPISPEEAGNGGNRDGLNGIMMFMAQGNTTIWRKGSSEISLVLSCSGKKKIPSAVTVTVVNKEFK